MNLPVRNKASGFLTEAQAVAVGIILPVLDRDGQAGVHQGVGSVAVAGHDVLIDGAGLQALQADDRISSAGSIFVIIVRISISYLINESV